MIGNLNESENEGAEFVDPVSVTRLSKRNILALALSLAGVLLVLFFSSRRQSAELSTEYELAPSPAVDCTHIGTGRAAYSHAQSLGALYTNTSRAHRRTKIHL